MIETPQQILQKEIDIHRTFLDHITSQKDKLSDNRYLELFEPANAQIRLFRVALSVLDNSQIMADAQAALNRTCKSQ